MTRPAVPAWNFHQSCRYTPQTLLPFWPLIPLWVKMLVLLLNLQGFWQMDSCLVLGEQKGQGLLPFEVKELVIVSKLGSKITIFLRLFLQIALLTFWLQVYPQLQSLQEAPKALAYYPLKLISQRLLLLTQKSHQILLPFLQQGD